MIEGYTDEECLKFTLFGKDCPKDGCYYLPTGRCVGVDKVAESEESEEESEEEVSEESEEEEEEESEESEEETAGVQVSPDLWKITGGGTFSDRAPTRPRPQYTPGETALPPYEDKQTNISIRNKYYFRDPRPDQYDFDPNSNVPQSRGSVRSIGRRNPVPRQPRSRIQRRPDKKLEKPAKKSVKVNPKVQKTPPSFAKTINQLLPILLILALFLFIVYFYKKRGKY